MNFTKLCNEYCKVYNISAEPNLNLLKLSVDPQVTWRNETPTLATEEANTRQLNVQYTPNQLELYSDVETTKESVCKTRVTLVEGIAPGLNKPLRIPTTGLPPSLGQYVEIQPGKDIHEKEDKMIVKVGSAHRMDSSNPALATVSSKETFFEGRFSCTVRLGGKVLFPIANGRVREHGIADIFYDVKNWPKENQKVVENDMTELKLVKGTDRAPGEIKWTVTGTCEFRGDFEQTIEWK